MSRRATARVRVPFVGLATMLMLSWGCSTKMSQPPAGHVLLSPASTPVAPTGPVPLLTAGAGGATREAVFGHSVQGRSLIVRSRGPADARRRILVVGCVHGDEAAGVDLALSALSQAPPTGTELVVVSDTNPDGHAARTRQNAHGVDLNRNFPYQWRSLGHRGDQQYAGPRPLSEPESAAMAALIRQVRPTASVWFHQPVDVVDLSGGTASVERRFATVSGLALHQLSRYPGSAVGWQNVTWPGTTAFVVELPRPVPASVQRAVRSAIVNVESLQP